MDVFLRGLRSFWYFSLVASIKKILISCYLFLKINRFKKRQKILKVKSPGQSINQGRANLGAYLTFLRCQNLHQLRVPFFTIADKSMF